MEQRSALANIPLRPRESGNRIPLTGSQLRIWRFKNQQRTWQSIRSCAVGVRICGRLDTELLRSCIEYVVRRHDSLRTRFTDLEHAPAQVIDEPEDYRLEIVDLSAVPVPEVEAELVRRVDAFVMEKIDLAVGPLFAARLYRLSPREHVLICALDHMIADGTSMCILDSEIWTLYGQGARGLPFSLPPLPVQFADYAVWQSRTYSARRQRNEPYWRARLERAPQVRLPGSNGIRNETNSKAALYYFPLGIELSRRLREFAERERTLLPLVVLTIHVAVTARWCDRQDLVLTFISNSRYRKELHAMIGFLATFLHLRVAVMPEDSYRDCLRSVSREFYSALVHDDLDQVPDFLPEWEFGATDPHFNWVPSQETVRSFAGTRHDTNPVSVQPFQYRVAGSSCFLPVFTEVDREIHMVVHHLPHRFATADIARFGDNLRRFAEEFVQDPAARIAQYR